MNEDIFICYILIFAFLVIRIKYFGIFSFWQLLLSISLLLSIGTVIFLIYDSWLDEKISKREVQNVLDNVYKDIDIVTTINVDKDIDDPDFPQDVKDDKNNKKLIRNSLLIGLIPLFILLVIIYYTYGNLAHVYKNIISILIIYIMELYFSWSILSEFKGVDLQNLRRDIIDKIKNLK